MVHVTQPPQTKFGFQHLFQDFRIYLPGKFLDLICFALVHSKGFELEATGQQKHLPCQTTMEFLRFPCWMQQIPYNYSNTKKFKVS